MSEDDAPKDNQEDAVKGPVLTEQKQPRAKNPAIFLGIIALVMGLGLVIGLYKRGNVIVETNREAYMPERVEHDEGGDLQDMPMLDVIRQTSGQEPQATPGGPRGPRPPAAEKPECEFSGFVGQQYDESFAQMIKDAGNSERPLRILKPGDAYTQDFAPNRVNIDLDEAGIVTRIWCG